MVSKVEHKTRTGCPVACALDIIGDHWTLLIIRNLMFSGLHEYKEMLATEEKISSSILSDRLKKLESQGVISSFAHPENQKRKFYYLTVIGKDLLPLLVEMILWANTHLAEHLNIPPEKKRLLENDPEQFKRIVMAEIAAWEKKNSVNQHG